MAFEFSYSLLSVYYDTLMSVTIGVSVRQLFCLEKKAVRISLILGSEYGQDQAEKDGDHGETSDRNYLNRINKILNT